MSDIKTFTVVGFREEQLPVMTFPASMKRAEAKAAFEAAHPGFTMGDAFPGGHDEDGEPEGFPEGDFCEACDLFLVMDGTHGVDEESGARFCAPCWADALRRQAEWDAREVPAPVRDDG